MKFSTNFWSSKDTFPIGTCTLPALSTRYSTLPALISLTALVTSIVTVPVLGFGIKPRGPKTRPNLPTSAIISGVATTTSNSIQPCWILLIISLSPTKSAPAASASLAFSPLANTNTERTFPVP